MSRQGRCVGATASGYTANTIPSGTVLADGVQAISARFVTPGGTASALSQALTVSVDTTAPSAPSGAPDLVPVSDSGSSSTDNLTNDTTPTLSGTGGVPGDTVNLDANGNLIGSAVPRTYSTAVSGLDLTGCTRLVPQNLAAVLSFTPHLTVLILAGCNQFSAGALAAALAQVPRLRQLDVQYW